VLLRSGIRALYSGKAAFNYSTNRLNSCDEFTRANLGQWE